MIIWCQKLKIYLVPPVILDICTGFAGEENGAGRGFTRCTAGIPVRPTAKLLYKYKKANYETTRIRAGGY